MAQQSPGLQRNAIGLTEVLFQSITFMAPAVAVALSIGFATTYALGLTPLAVVLAVPTRWVRVPARTTERARPPDRTRPALPRA